jgi:hypothetical protein
MTAEELTMAFLKTPEMAEHQKVIGTENARLDEGDTEIVCLQVPKQFLTMLEFVERNNAADAGRTPAPTTDVLSQIVKNELHDMLHWLVVQPAHFAHYRNLWNRFCEEQNAPEQKIPDRQASAKPDEEDPF